jgi:hypothetical protein
VALSKSFGGFPAVSNSFFFVALADASNLPKTLPARAKVLQMADGGRVALGERADQVCLDLTLRGKTAEVARQIEQVFAGMLALVTLGQPEYPDVVDLAKSAKVSSSQELVTISLEYPASKVIAKVTEEMSPKPKKEKPAKQKSRSKAKAKRAPQPPAEPQAEDEAAPSTEPSADAQPPVESKAQAGSATKPEA